PRRRGANRATFRCCRGPAYGPARGRAAPRPLPRRGRAGARATPAPGGDTRARRPHASGLSSAFTIKRPAEPTFFSVTQLTGQMCGRDTCADLPSRAGGGGVALDPEEEFVGAGKHLRPPQGDHRRTARGRRG